MNINERFEQWFEENFTTEKFGSFFRLAVKEDIKKAYIEGLQLGYASTMDRELSLQISKFLDAK